VEQWSEAMLTYWKGTVSELLRQLNDLTEIPESTKRSSSWPKDHRALGKVIERLIPQFRQEGIEIQKLRNRCERYIVIGLKNSL